ncbi:uncharacterized protein YdgA (DUF945 family) [Deinococcus metalli]|uniref:Uncharacterized protein YdgA (DUF945 family) n=1 Tax=Deinococcus metalli TaxID=1141878 RepID=A0A7W8KE54_9DEIO|nr:YdgA family protein [Deinococcus metalli]MBB5375398.1 uncharacterized protein YdgA (DUF945 family) [Deinococcus metalli]GHF29585.1 hypothetical protein GCM10017781_01970 [Deinococcus metalli]
MTRITKPPPGRARPRRRSPLAAVALTAVIALGAVAGATAVFAGRTQAVANDLTTQLNATLGPTGVVTVTQTAYRRGLTSSTQILDVRISDQGAGVPFDVIVTNRIQHGPFPGLRGVAQATVDTEVAFKDAAAQAAYDRAFPNRKPTLHTVVGLAGGSDSTLDVPAGSVRADDGTQVTWQAAHALLAVAGTTTRSTVTWPGGTVVSADGGATVRGLTATGTTHQSAGRALGTGTATVELQGVSFIGGGQNVELGTVKVSSETTEAGGFYGSAARYDVGTLKAGGQTVSDLRVHVGVSHVPGAPLERIVTLLQQAQQGSVAPGRRETLTPAQQQQLQSDLLDVLRGGPALDIERISVTRPAGEVAVTGRITVPGAATLTAPQLAQVAQSPALLGGLLAVTLNVRGSEAAITDLVSSVGAPGQGIAQNLGALEQAGYITRAGRTLSTTLRLDGGAVTLNGRSLGE